MWNQQKFNTVIKHWVSFSIYQQWCKTCFMHLCTLFKLSAWTFLYIMVLYKKLVPSIFFRSIPSRSSLSFSRISILFLSSSQSEIWTVDGFERYRVDKQKIGTFHHYHTRNHSKERRLWEKRKQGDLDCTFRGGLYSSWAQISWSWSACS